MHESVETYTHLDKYHLQQAACIVHPGHDCVFQCRTNASRTINGQ